MNSKNAKDEILEIRRTVFRVIGDSYTHRRKLKELGCHWNSKDKCWESEKPFSEEEQKQLNELHLLIQEEQVINELHLSITPLERSSLEEFQTFKGKITEIYNSREYLVCSLCSSSVAKDYYCKRCEKTILPEKRLVFTLVLEDETEALKATFFSKLAEKLLMLSKNEKKLILSLSSIERNDSSIIADKINQLIGREIIVKGKIEVNEYTHLREIKATSFFKIS
ncbi:MAG: hypothetical protein ACTSYA_07640 [Candidatus Kariarchaeaceae archaeon]